MKALLLIAVGLVASVGMASAQALPTPLVEYTFDGSSLANTGSTSGGTLSAVDGASFSASTPSGSGSALQLSSTGPEYATGSAASSISGLTTLTLSCWIDLSSLSSAADTDRLVSTLTAGAGLDFTIQGSPSALKLGLNINTTFGPTSTTLNASQGWVFVAATYTWSGTSGTVTFYTGTSTTAVTQLGTAATISTSLGNGGGSVGFSSTLDIGATPQTASDRTPNALIDDVLVYGSALSSSQLDAVRQLDVVPEPSVVSFMALGLISLFPIVRRWRRGRVSDRLLHEA